LSERVILADCCEDWIIEWGRFYRPATEFACPECATEWRKEGPATFVRVSDRHAFQQRERGSDGVAFAYLGAADGREPVTDRCCAKILLQHGEHLAPGTFICPVCRTRWTIGSTRAHGLRLPTFAKEGLEEPLTIQQGRTRPFLIALSRYSAPRE